MARLVPLPTAVVEPGWAARVVSPPHDALTPGERWAHLRDHPDSYLGVTRSLEDLGPGDRATPAELLGRCRASLHRLLAAGAFGAAPRPGLLLYRLTDGDHTQVGVVGGTAVADHADGTVRVHEQVRPERAVALADHVRVLRVQSSPIALARRPDPGLDAVVADAEAAAEPLVDLRSDDGVRQQVWPVVRPGNEVALIDGLAGRPLYVIDGHHRAEAARLLRATDPSPDAATVLSVVFPSDQLENRSFPRCLPRVDPGRLVHELARRFPVRSASAAEVAHRSPDELALLAGGRWYRVEVPSGPGTAEADHPLVAGLDAVRLQHQVLAPLLGIDPTEADHGLAYLPPGDATTDDAAGLERLARRGAGEGCAAVWVLRPVPVSTLLDVADAGLSLPPKSTYFEPKVRSGVFLRSLT